MQTSVLLFSIMFFFLVAFVQAETITELHSNGAIYKKITVENNKRNGLYEEYDENGKIKLRGFYKQDEKEGLFKTHSPNGDVIAEESYSAGKLNGSRKIFKDNTVLQDEFWIDGILAYPKSIQQINYQLKLIPSLKTEYVGEWPKGFDEKRFTIQVENDNKNALSVLREYRYLCDLPFENIKINRKYLAINLDAILLMKNAKSCTHYIANPGMSAELYKTALLGTMSSNLAHGPKMDGKASIHGYIYDSNLANKEHLGHRAWCLNPYLQETAFASADDYSAMWAIHTATDLVSDFSFICYPPRGYIPLSHFKNNLIYMTEPRVWSISLNLKKYKTPDNQQIKIKAYSYKNKKKTPLFISNKLVSIEGSGLGNCIIFNIDKLEVQSHCCYFIEVDGIQRIDGKMDKIEYYVEFF